MLSSIESEKLTRRRRRKSDLIQRMEEEAPPAPPSPSPSPSPSPTEAWRTYISEDLPRTVQDSADSAIRSAISIQQSSSTHLRSLQDFIPQIGARYSQYEDAFVHKVKDELVSVREHPALACGVAATAALLLMRGPRRFLFRQTFGRLQSEEARFVRAEKNVKELEVSVELMKNESKKLLERSVLAEKEMKRGYSDLKNAGTQIQSHARLVYKAEAEAVDLMDLLREVPGRDALKLRAEVASMASNLKQQRLAIDKKILKISDLGVPV